jgi:rare lipoprotein A
MTTPLHGRLAILVLALSLSACATGRTVSPPTGRSTTSVPSVPAAQEGLASYYGSRFHGKTMASGKPFDMNAMVAAHPSYPMGTLVRVRNLENGRTVQVRILDRGPTRRYQADGVIIDLSRGAAERLGFIRDGRTRVRVEVLSLGDR